MGAAEGPNDDSREQQELLARLNALKPSTVSLNNAALAENVADSDDDNPEDLIERFSSLYGKKHPAQLGHPPKESGLDGEADEGSEPAAPPSPTIEELLAELEENGGDYKLDESEEVEVRALMETAKQAMVATAGEGAENKDDGTQQAHAPAEKGQEPPVPQNTRDEGHGAAIRDNASEIDDAEAQEALQRILDEADYEEPEETTDSASSASRKPQDQKKTTGDDNVRKSDKAEQLSSFANLHFPFDTSNQAVDAALNLPSAPTGDPVSVSAIRKQTRQAAAKAKAKKPGYTDEEIESWCVICYATATVRCFGCDKDLYCWGCWREGHMGEDAGADERTHEWERWSKPKSGGS